MTTIKILYIHQDGLMTGSAISLMNMIRGFSNKSIIPEIIFFSDGPAVEIIRKLEVKCHVLNEYTFWTTPGPRWYQRENIKNYKALLPSKKIRKLIKSISPDIIHINDKAALKAGISSIGLNIPVIQHLRSTNYICRSFVNKWISTKLIDFYATHKIAISEDEAVDFKKTNTSIVFNSIDFDEIDIALQNKTVLSRNKLLIGWIGRFSNSKGSWDFIKVAGNLKKLYPNIEFHMLAPMPHEDEKELIENRIINKKEYLLALIQEHGVKDDLILHGYRKDFLAVAASMDIIINCNRLGALGRQAFETVCLGVPSIVTAKYPKRSSVLNEQISMIVDEGDIDAITSAACRLIEDAVLRISISIRARDWAKLHFDNKIQSNKVLNIYNAILNH